MIHRIRPPAASRKWPRISAGGKRLAPLARSRSPPRLSQVASRTKPPTAVTIQVINAATPMVASLSSVRSATGPEPVDLRGLLHHADPVAEGELPTEPAGDQQQRERGGGQRDQPGRDAA